MAVVTKLIFVTKLSSFLVPRRALRRDALHILLRNYCTVFLMSPAAFVGMFKIIEIWHILKPFHIIKLILAISWSIFEIL
jgi:hypothetical protein